MSSPVIMQQIFRMVYQATSRITPFQSFHQIKTAITDRQLSPVTKIMKIQILSIMLMAVSLVLNESLKYRHKIQFTQLIDIF